MSTKNKMDYSMYIKKYSNYLLICRIIAAVFFLSTLILTSKIIHDHNLGVDSNAWAFGIISSSILTISSALSIKFNYMLKLKVVTKNTHWPSIEDD